MSREERLAIWEQAREQLQKKAPRLLRETKKLRKEWDRKLPKLHS